MSRFSFPTFLVFAAIAFLGGGRLFESSASAQEAENVKIVTADGVRLHGVFYASAKKNAATVIMLHPIGDGKSSKPQDWKNLATHLQKEGYSVMMFDFRGHGESTTLEDAKLFWSKLPNANNVKVKDRKDETIDVKDYIKNGAAYFPILVNDIAAVRSYLDRRNDDTKDCNTSSLIVVGADNGATLGALWINAEWHRYRYSPPPNVFVLNPKFLERNPEGKDIIGVVFLTPQLTFDKRSVSVSGLLKIACKDNATAAAFFCGEEDTKAKDIAVGLENKLKPKGSKKHDYIGAVKLKTNLTGIKLLQKGLKTDELISKYLDGVVDDRKNDRIERDFLTNYYLWKSPATGVLTPAKNKKGEKNLNFDDYGRFITQ